MKHKYFVVTDVHGFYSEMREALDKAGFNPANPRHIFVSCGDLLDRGSMPMECLQYVLSLPHKILIRGNHEDLMEQAVTSGYFDTVDISNGTYGTVIALTGEAFPPTNLGAMRTHPLYNRYINETIDFYETKRYIFVHGWIPVNRKMNGEIYKPDWRDADKPRWDNARWLNGMDMWNKGVREPDKTIVCGHWHCNWGNAYLHNDGKEWPQPGESDAIVNFNPFVDKGIIALDGCTAYSGKVNCIVLED